jgi:hypothetical protein
MVRTDRGPSVERAAGGPAASRGILRPMGWANCLLSSGVVVFSQFSRSDAVRDVP